VRLICNLTKAHERKGGNSRLPGFLHSKIR
jgi:hypothetical protein